MSAAPIALAQIERAAAVLAPDIVRTPLVELELDDRPGRVFLKLENLQPIGSFKLRGALNALERLGSDADGGDAIALSACTFRTSTTAAGLARIKINRP